MRQSHAAQLIHVQFGHLFHQREVLEKGYNAHWKAVKEIKQMTKLKPLVDLLIFVLVSRVCCVELEPKKAPLAAMS